MADNQGVVKSGSSGNVQNCKATASQSAQISSVILPLAGPAFRLQGRLSFEGFKVCNVLNSAECIEDGGKVFAIHWRAPGDTIRPIIDTSAN